MSTVETIATTSVTAIEPFDDSGSAVRFETQCVVIPDLAQPSSRLPRVVTKSYALPLWKRRTASGSHSTSASPEDASSEENQSHLVLRVPLPTFSRKYHSIARSVDHTPLPSCLVHRALPSSSSCAGPPSIQHTRTSRKPSPSPSRSDVATVPLRPCCAACQSVTEAALVSGEAWPERFSRAASRRRSRSADGSPRTLTVAGSTVSASYGTLGVSISVDEMDKRRRSSDTGLSISRQALSGDATTNGDCRVPLILRRTAPSSSSTLDARPPPSPTRITPATPRIPEEEDAEGEDENELFPLPSPKRTPTASPAPSPAGSLSSLMAAQVCQSSTISPIPSTCSGDSAGPNTTKRQFLAPPPCSSSSSLSLPGFSESTTDLTTTEEPPSPSVLSALPTLSGRHSLRSPSPRISFIPPSPADTLPFTGDSAPPMTPQSPKFESDSPPIAIPSPTSPSQLSTSLHHSPTHTRFPWRSKRSVSADVSPKHSPPVPSYSPSASPVLSTSPNTKKSFLISNPRHIIVDVLRGVGAMGSNGIGPGV